MYQHYNIYNKCILGKMCHNVILQLSAIIHIHLNMLVCYHKYSKIKYLNIIKYTVGINLVSSFRFSATPGTWIFKFPIFLRTSRSIPKSIGNLYEIYYNMSGS